MRLLISVVFASALLFSACDSGVSVDPDEAYRTQTEQSIQVAPASPFVDGVMENKSRMPIAGKATGAGHFYIKRNSPDRHWRSFTINAIQTEGNQARGTFHLGHHLQREEGLRDGDPVSIGKGSVDCAIFVYDQAEIVGKFEDGTPYLVYMIDGKHEGNPDKMTLAHRGDWVKDWAYDAVCNGDRPTTILWEEQGIDFTRYLVKIQQGNLSVWDYTHTDG